MENLSKKELWINPDYSYLFNRTIIEYDMKEAGYSLIKEYELLPEKTIKKLATLSKQNRTIQIGKIQRSNQELAKKLSDAFARARNIFYTMNRLEKEDILSVKKDAIFTIKSCQITQIGEYVVFRPKNEYTSYLHLDSRLEFYYHPNKHDIKGIGKDNVAKHEGYMSSILDSFCRRMETEGSSATIDYIIRMIQRYKMRELDIGYYRTFNQKSEFIMIDEPDIIYDQLTNDYINDIDITYNYFNILLKLVKIPL